MSTSSWLLCPLDTCLWFLELFILWGKLSLAYLTLSMPVGLSLSIVMLLLGLPGALLSWAHSCYSSPHRHFPHWSPCCGWTCPCGSWLWPSGNFEMAKFIMHMSWRVQGMPRATQQGPRQRARWIMNEPGPVLLSCWGQWLGTWGFQSVSVGN